MTRFIGSDAPDFETETAQDRRCHHQRKRNRPCGFQATATRTACRITFCFAAVFALLPTAALADSAVVLQWNAALLDAVKSTRASDVATARALGVVHTAMFDAWAAYDGKAMATQTGALWRRPAAERTAVNKERAISYAAFRALVDLFPSQQENLARTLRTIGHDPDDLSAEPASAAGIGNLAARHVLYARHRDRANQLGDLREGSYVDWTSWRPVNPPDKLLEPRRFQPPSSTNAQGQLQVRNFTAAHFALMQPFALETPAEFRPSVAPVQQGSDPEARQLAAEVIRISAGLVDTHKASAEFWALDAGTDTPPGYWAKLAQFVAGRRGHDLDADIKLFFVLGNALLDAAIATVDAKVFWNGARPEAFIRHYFRGETIQAWGGPGRGTRAVKGEDFRPYLPTSASPEHISGHSSFSAAGATAIRLASNSDALGFETTIRANSFKIETGPAQDVRLHWDTLTAAAESAGWSRVYGGIHFSTGDRYGRELGEQVARKVWQRAHVYLTGNPADGGTR